jgi:hypothetical protein
VQVIDDDGMGVVLPVFGQMRVVGRQIGVVVWQDGLVIVRPEPQDGGQSRRADDGKRNRRNGKSGTRADPASEGIGYQPAGVGQSELRGKDSAAVCLAG